MNPLLAHSKFDLTGKDIPLKSSASTTNPSLSLSKYNLDGSQIIFKKNSYSSSERGNVFHNVSAPSSSSLKTDNLEAIMKVHAFKEQYKINNPEEYSSKQVTIEECVSCSIDAYPVISKDVGKNSARKVVPADNFLSDESKKEFARSMTFEDVKVSCDCKLNKGSCLRNLQAGQVHDMHEEFWGKKEDPAPTRNERKIKLTKIINNAHRRIGTKDIFQYYFGEKEVCEYAYLRALGIMKNNRVPDSYIMLKNEILNPGITEKNRTILQNKSESEKPKYNHAVLFLENMAEYFGEGGYGETNSDVKYIPFDNWKEVYDEYRAKTLREHNEVVFNSNKLLAGPTTFRQAYMSKRLQIRLRTSKGAFDTCSVCNAFHEILKSNSTDWSNEKVDMVQKFKRLHLELQSEERKDSELRKHKAKNEFDDQGNPLYAYFEADGYTKYKCLTPRNYNRNVKGDTKRIGNNVIGIVVVCGPIQTRFVYSVDDLVENDANMMIEIMRQAFHDLGKLLANYEGRTYKSPRISFLQFDNCGVNKNQYMFGYLSLLIEHGHFDEIHVNFLIVGHTHTTIDQYFSVITNKMKGKFIGSPLALQHIFNSCQEPLVNRQLSAFYDYRQYLNPVINKDLHHYGLPHVFVFKRRLGVAVCQHKPYSRSPRFYPIEPDNRPKVPADLAGLSRPLTIESLSFLGGVERIHSALDIAKTSAAELTQNPVEWIKLQLLNEIIVPLQKVESTVSCELSNKMELQAAVGYLTTLTDESLELQEEDDADSSDLGVDNENEDTEDAIVTNKASTRNKSSTAHLLQDPMIDIPEVKEDQLKEFRETLSKFNHEETGYLLWLTYTNVDKDWYKSTPKLFDCSKDESVLIKLKLKEPDETTLGNKIVKRQQHRAAAIAKAVENIKVVSKDILKQLNDGFYTVNPCKEEFSYKERHLSEQEIEFYETCKTLEGVIHRNHQQIMIEYGEKYDLFPLNNFSEEQKQDIENRQAKMKKELADQLTKIKLITGTKTSQHPYLDTENQAHQPEVMAHTKRSNNGKKKVKKNEEKCAVKDCGGEGTHSCRSKECVAALRKYCDTHYLQGGHSKHKDKELKIKPAAPVVTTTKAVTSTVTIPPPTSSTTRGKSDTCGVLECDEKRVKQCKQTDCLLWVCELHGMRDHESHCMQIRKEPVIDLDIDDDESDDESTQESLQSSVSKKSRTE